MTHAEAIAAIKANWPTENYTMLREALTLACAALASPPASFHKRPFACSSASPCADCQHHEFCRSWLDGVGRCVKAPAPPASDQPGLVGVVAEFQRAHADYQRAKHEDVGQEFAWAARKAARDAVLAYPLPASPQAETKGDES